MRNFTKRLMAYETLGNKSSGTNTPAGFRIWEKLRPHLATLMGDGGFRALLTRALALASAEAPALQAVRVKADGTLEGLEELQAQVDANQFFECNTVLLAQLLGLLVAFIGENLTLRLMREVWPKVPFSNLD
jgi:hypothetical protein